MQRYVKFFLLILVIIPILTISPNGKSLFQKKAYVFGTIIDIQIYGESKKLATKASEEILSNFNNLHQLLHPWREGLMFEINEAIQITMPNFIINKVSVNVEGFCFKCK